MNTFDILFLSILVLIPILDRAYYFKVLPNLKVNKGRAKYYSQTIIQLGLMGIISLVLCWYQILSFPLSNLKMDLIFNVEQILGLSITLSLYVMAILSLKAIRAKPEAAMQIVTQFGETGPLMPKTLTEARLFQLVSVSAGVWEEIVFRGIVFGMLLPLIGVVGAMILSSLLFGFQHYYLGKIHIIKTSFVGLFMAVLYYYTETLIVPISLHIMIDLMAGLQYRAAYQVVEKVLPTHADVAKALNKNNIKTKK